MKLLTNDEIDCIEKYEFVSHELSKSKENRLKNTHLLCTKNTSGPYGCVKKIDKIKREDVTLWEITKSYFGFGLLAGCDLRLTSIANYLQTCDISSISTESASYRTIHGIASRMLIYKKENTTIPRLWEKLSTISTSVKINKYNKFSSLFFYPKLPLKSYSCHDSTNRFLFLTPLTTFGHLRAQIDILEGKRPSRAIKPGECVKIDECYRPTYNKRLDTDKVDENSLKEIFFRIIESVTINHFNTSTYERR